MIINQDGTVQFDGDTQKLLNGQSSGVAGASQSTLSPEAQAKLAAQNEAARAAKYGPAQVDKMKAAGSTFGGTARPAASIGTETNPAPVATSQAANELTFGQKVLRTIRGIARVGGVAQAGFGVNDAVKGNYGNAADNVFNGVATAINPGVGVAGTFLSGVRDAVMSPVIDYIYGRNKTFNVPKAGVNGPAAAVPAGPSPNVPVTAGGEVSPEVLFQDQGRSLIPAPGEGAFKRTTPGNEGRAQKVFGGAGGAGPIIAAAAPVGAKPLVAPKLGTEGGLFGNMVNFSNAVNQEKLNAAQGTRDFNRGVKSATLETQQAKVGIDAENARSARIKAVAALANVGHGDKKVVTGLMGEPIIVDTNKGSATAPTVNKPVTEADIQETMKKNKMTREQVLQRLQQEGKM